jgi:excisionase family DNA binding protein
MGVTSAIRTLEEFVARAKELDAKEGRGGGDVASRPASTPLAAAGTHAAGGPAGSLERALAESQRPLVSAIRHIREELARLADSRARAPDDAPDFLTVAEVSARTGCCTKTVRGWIKEGRLQAFRWGSSRELRVRREDLLAFQNGAKSTSDGAGIGASTDDRVRDILARIPTRSR